MHRQLFAALAAGACVSCAMAQSTVSHGFQAWNAYFDDELNAVLFAYFPDEDDPDANLPGQPVS